MFLYIPPSSLAFHIPLIIPLQQLKMSEKCVLSQPIKLQMFCILTILHNKLNDKVRENFLFLLLVMEVSDKRKVLF